jgi:hypothetical protein
LSDNLPISAYTTRMDLQSKINSEVITGLKDVRCIGIMTQLKLISKLFIQFVYDECPRIFETSETQFGAKMNRSTLHAYSTLKERLRFLKRNINVNENLHILSVDLK